MRIPPAVSPDAPDSRPVAAPRAALRAALLALAIPLAATALLTALRPDDALAQADEAWALETAWAEGGAPNAAGHLVDPAGVAATRDGTVFVADAAEARIHVFRDADGGWQRAWGAPGQAQGEMDEPRGLALLDGDLLVADSGNGRIQRFDADGGFLDAWDVPGQPWALAVGGGRVLVADRAGDAVHVLDEDGRRLDSWGGSGSGAGELRAPVGVAVLADGRVAVADAGNGRVQIWSAEGAPERELGYGSELRGLAADGEGALYLLQRSSVQRIDPDTGAPTGSASFFPARAGGGLAISGPDLPGAVGDALWVSLRYDFDFLNGLRRIHTESMQSTGEWIDFAEPPGELVGPNRLAAGPEGAGFLILDAWPRLQRFDAQRRFLSLDLLTGARDVLALDAGGDLLVSYGSRVERRRSGPGGPGGPGAPWVFPPGGAPLWATALAADPTQDRLYLADLLGGRVLVLDGAGAELAAWDFVGPGLQAVSDMDALPDRRLALVRRAQRQIEIRDPDSGAVLDRWDLRGAPLRVAADRGPDNPGGAFVLTSEGGVWRYGADGALRAWWDATGAEAGLDAAPSDLLSTPDGRLHVADARGQRVLVFAPDPGREPAPPPSSEGCRFVRDKQAGPPRITLGETVGVTLTVSGECREAARDTDVIVVLDRSGSMEGQKIAAARGAVASFLTDLDFGSARAGLVLFNSDAELAQPLTADAGLLLEALIEESQPFGGTDIGEAVDLAAQALADEGRPGAEPVIVVLTDGRPDGAEVDADAAATRAKAAGARLFTIGFGNDTDPALLARMASAPDDFFFAPGEAELARIYVEIARRITGGLILESGVITDVIPVDMAYVPGSAEPPAELAGRVLTWRVGPSSSGLRLSYRLRPTRTGLRPTNVEARMRYRDALSAEGELIFPVPRVLVVGPPRPIYLPLALKAGCLQSQTPSDIALVIDTSSSMAGEKLAAAKEAARIFVEQLDLARDQAAILGFDAEPRIALGLSADEAALRGAIDSLANGSGTVIDGGLQAAIGELSGPRARARASKVIVLLTDGQNNAGPDPVRSVAAEARAWGIEIFTIALGADADAALMRELAGDPARAFVAPGPADLARIYRDIAGAIPCR